MNPNVTLTSTRTVDGGYLIDGINYDYSKFPGGEIHVRIPKKISRCTIKASICGSDDLMTVLLLNDAAKRAGAMYVSLELMYIPYAQQDRICESGEALSIKVFADLINSCGFNRVTVYDPHSYVSTALINNCKIVEVADIIKSEEFQSKLDDVIDVLVAPDAGAYKKVINLSRFEYLYDGCINYFNAAVVHATKNRVNGEVQSVTLHGDVAGKNCLVIDDICVGGRTFTELGKALKDAGAGDLSLYVTHGIFSKGLDELNLYYKKIYSTDSRPESVKLAEEKKIELVKL